MRRPSLADAGSIYQHLDNIDFWIHSLARAIFSPFLNINDAEVLPFPRSWDVALRVWLGLEKRLQSLITVWCDPSSQAELLWPSNLKVIEATLLVEF